MSITLKLTELSPELEKQLAAMSEEERGRFATVAIQEKLAEAMDDPAVWANSAGIEKRTLSPEDVAILRETLDGPVAGPTDAMKAAIAHWKQMTGRNKDAAAV